MRPRRDDYTGRVLDDDLGEELSYLGLDVLDSYDEDQDFINEVAFGPRGR